MNKTRGTPNTNESLVAQRLICMIAALSFAANDSASFGPTILLTACSTTIISNDVRNALEYIATSVEEPHTPSKIVGHHINMSAIACVPHKGNAIAHISFLLITVDGFDSLFDTINHFVATIAVTSQLVTTNANDA